MLANKATSQPTVEEAHLRQQQVRKLIRPSATVSFFEKLEILKAHPVQPCESGLEDQFKTCKTYQRKSQDGTDQIRK